MHDLYNGNISRMVTVMRDASGNAIPVQGRTFRYDQLNRIKEVNAWTDANVVSTNNWGTTAMNNGDYYERFSFDLNGNIETAVRNGNLPNWHQYMDNMIYTYISGTNKLDYAMDNAIALSTDYSNDIDAGQTFGNYDYDAIGNLTKDVSEEIDNIEWNNQGKITTITRTNTSTKSDLEFLYDAAGQRVAKIVKPRTGGTLQSEDKWEYTMYSRDASGNVLAVYKMEYKSQGGNDWQMIYDLRENHLYAPWRIGIKYDQQSAVTRDFSGGFSNNTFDLSNASWLTTAVEPSIDPVFRTRLLGYKSYEIINNVGTVLATFSDRRIAQGSSGIVNYYIPEVLTFSDGYVFGAPMPGRVYVGAFGQNRHGFGGEEFDPNSNYSEYEYRMYDSRLGRWTSVEPLQSLFPMHSPYSFAWNTPVLLCDHNGQYAGVDDVLAAVVGGVINLAVGCATGEVQTVGQGFSYFGAGAAAGWMALYPEFGGWIVGGAILTANQISVYEENHPYERMSTGEKILTVTTGAVFNEVGGRVFEKAFSFVVGQFTNAEGRVVKEVIEVGKFEPGMIMIEGAPPGMYSAQNLTTVTRHLAQFGEHIENDIMLDRMRRIALGELDPTDIDINFMNHELREAELMASGMTKPEAHEATLIEQGMYQKGYENKIYTKEALEAAEAADKAKYGIKD